MLITVTGTTLIRGGNSPTWMKRKRKRLNGKLASVTAVHWPATQFRSCVVTEVSDCHVFNTAMCLTLPCSRDERRWIEKQNRASRAQRKKEEMNRIRTLVGTVWASTHCRMNGTIKKNIKESMETVYNMVHGPGNPCWTWVLLLHFYRYCLQLWP